ncbi:MAG: transposase [Devosia sp.]|nr:transposase [Devosia sp.]
MDTISLDGAGGGEAGARRQRKTYTVEEKQRLVAESYEPGVSVSLVARRHDINANLLFTWRRQMRAPAPVVQPLELIPIEVVSAPAATTAMASEVEPRGVIEIILAGGVCVRVDAGVSEAALKRVLAAVRAAA